MSKENNVLAIFMATRSSLMRAVMRIVPPREVEDIVQETYVRVCQIEKKGGSIHQPRALMYKTANNLALDYLKRADNRLVCNIEDYAELNSEWLAHTDETLRGAVSDEQFSLFCEAVRELPLQCRRIFVLKKVYGYSQKEIAIKMNLSENTIEKHVATGIRLCASFMKREGMREPKRGSMKQPTKNNGGVGVVKAKGDGSGIAKTKGACGE